MTSNCVKINMYFLKIFNSFKLWVYTIKLISLYSGRFTKHFVQPLFYEFIYFIQVYKNHKFNNIIFTVQKDGPRLCGDKTFVPPKNTSLKCHNKIQAHTKIWSFSLFEMLKDNNLNNWIIFMYQNNI